MLSIILVISTLLALILNLTMVYQQYISGHSIQVYH